MNVFRLKAAELLSPETYYTEISVTGEQIANVYRELRGEELDILKDFDYKKAYLEGDGDESLLALYIAVVQVAYYWWMKEGRHGKPDQVEIAYNQLLVWKMRLADKMATPVDQKVRHMWSH